MCCIARHTHIFAESTVASPYPCSDVAIARGLPTCAHLYPPHPLRDHLGQKRPFRHDCRITFQALA
ncbi:DUF6925 family protein [Bradyrhizobium retamae]|uniref:DUF6925 family protein n=1 Tax=Bradyrhizobium retamae TaxID=1300035 RepID=UPI003D31457D